MKDATAFVMMKKVLAPPVTAAKGATMASMRMWRTFSLICALISSALACLIDSVIECLNLVIFLLMSDVAVAVKRRRGEIECWLRVASHRMEMDLLRMFLLMHGTFTCLEFVIFNMLDLCTDAANILYIYIKKLGDPFASLTREIRSLERYLLNWSSNGIVDYRAFFTSASFSALSCFACCAIVFNSVWVTQMIFALEGWYQQLAHCTARCASTSLLVSKHPAAFGLPLPPGLSLSWRAHESACHQPWLTCQWIPILLGYCLRCENTFPINRSLIIRKSSRRWFGEKAKPQPNQQGVYELYIAGDIIDSIQTWPFRRKYRDSRVFMVNAWKQTDQLGQRA